MPKENEWVFTFGNGQYPLAHMCVKIQGDYGEARQKMIDTFGTKWGFQYSVEEWEKMQNDPSRQYPLETEITWSDAVNVWKACNH